MATLIGCQNVNTITWSEIITKDRICANAWIGYVTNYLKYIVTAMLNHIIRKTFEPGRLYKAFIRQSHQFKPKDKSQAFDAFLPNELQV